MSATSLVRKKFTGISWQNPLLGAALRALDPLDAAVRYAHGRRDLPVYSARVRSNGIGGQFGGAAFKSHGETLARVLRDRASLSPNDRVLEIGCGCGRLALALMPVLADGTYTGVDIDATSLDACKRNPWLARKRFTFSLLDVHNPIWNPRATQSAASFVFPFSDASFSVIVLISVFTHMLPPELCNYVREIARMLRPAGKVAFSCFLMDHGNRSDGLSFAHVREDHWVHQEEIPEKAVGYHSSYLIRQFAAHDMRPVGAPLLGGWRRSDRIAPATDFAQDILLFSRDEGR